MPDDTGPQGEGRPLKSPDDLSDEGKEFWDAVMAARPSPPPSWQPSWQYTDGATVKGPQVDKVIMDDIKKAYDGLVSGYGGVPGVDPRESELPWNPDEEVLMSLPADGALIPYQGNDRLMLDMMVARHRERGLEVEFLQGIAARGIRRIIKVDDPSLPDKLRPQEYQLPVGHSWRDGLVTLGLLRGDPKPKGPQVLMGDLIPFRLIDHNVPAILQVRATVLNTGTQEGTATVALARREKDDNGTEFWDLLGGHTALCQPNDHVEALFETSLHETGTYAVRYQMPVERGGGLLVRDGRADLFTADGAKHTLHQDGSNSAIPFNGSPPRLHGGVWTPADLQNGWQPPHPPAMMP